jgi:hypothetical protein
MGFGNYKKSVTCSFPDIVATIYFTVHLSFLNLNLVGTCPGGRMRHCSKGVTIHNLAGTRPGGHLRHYSKPRSHYS